MHIIKSIDQAQQKAIDLIEAIDYDIPEILDATVGNSISPDVTSLVAAYLIELMSSNKGEKIEIKVADEGLMKAVANGRADASWYIAKELRGEAEKVRDAFTKACSGVVERLRDITIRNLDLVISIMDGIDQGPELQEAFNEHIDKMNDHIDVLEEIISSIKAGRKVNEFSEDLKKVGLSFHKFHTRLINLKIKGHLDDSDEYKLVKVLPDQYMFDINRLTDGALGVDWDSKMGPMSRFRPDKNLYSNLHTKSGDSLAIHIMNEVGRFMLHDAYLKPKFKQDGDKGLINALMDFLKKGSAIIQSIRAGLSQLGLKAVRQAAAMSDALELDLDFKSSRSPGFRAQNMIRRMGTRNESILDINIGDITIKVTVEQLIAKPARVA